MLAEDAAAMRGGRRQRPEAADEPAPPVDPSLMTERQQLAFLLRATAQDASSGADESSGDSSEDERPRRRPKRKAADGDAPAPKKPRRGRPPKTHKQPARASPRLAKAHVHAFPTAADGENSAAAANKAPHSPKRKRSPSPAPAPAPAPAAAATRRPLTAAPDFDTCALCGGAPFDALFLCPACDRKYPTQQALGRMCMT